MHKIIDFLATETQGKTYKSHRFCYDNEFQLPSLSYEESQSFTIRNDKYGETAKPKTTKLLKPLADKLQSNDISIFRYFLDGSRRIYKIDDIEYQRRIFPIVGGQIGVACCERISPSIFKKTIVEKHLVLSIPSAASMGLHPNQFLNRIVQQINNQGRLKRLGMKLSTILKYQAKKTEKGKEEYYNLGKATIQDMMIECEKKVVKQLVHKNLLNQDTYLIKDGSLQYQKVYKSTDFKELVKYKNNYRRVVGISKSFNPEFLKDRRNRSNAAKIANLPLYHRTPAAVFQEDRIGNVLFSVWYLRIRESKYTESPFAGIVKVEKVLVTKQEEIDGLDSGEIDRISANIINERNPVCYGNDQRWANHLYPIYLTEKYIKSLYLSDLHFINLF